MAGEADILQSRLTADDRNCPIVLISEEYKTSKFLLDPRKLARLLTGAAVVYAPEAGYNYKELEWMISRGFRCWNGMVRIYQPGVDFQNQQDALRHRYFPREKIEELGPDRVSDIIVRAVSRRRAFDRNAVTTIYDVDSRRRAAKLEMLRMDSGEASPDELREQVELLEDEVSRLVDVNEDLRKESAYAFEEGQRLETQYAEIQDELRTTRYKAESFETSSEELRERLAILQRRTSALDALETLPDSVFSAAKLIEKIHADKIVFLDEAYESAKEAGINNSASDLAKVWRALWAVSTTLHQLLFDPDEKSILKAFQSQTSFDLSMAAGAQTKKDSKLMALRKRNYKGREVDISPHVGFGNKPPRLLRIYFYADHGDQKIVVGHCGDHLDNFTTKSMS